jgi:elongation factor 1-gamma
VAKQDPKTTLCGSNLEEETTVLRWASFTNYELLPPIMAWINPVIGRSKATPEQLVKFEQECELTVRAIEKELKGGQYLVGGTLTLADLFVVSGLARGYQYVSPTPIPTGFQPLLTQTKVFTNSWAEKHPIVHKYYMNIRNDKDGIFDGILGKQVIRDVPGGTYPDYDGL